MSFDFDEVYRDADVLLNDEFIRQVVHNDVFSVVNMDEKELCESVVNDILFVTMWEKQTNTAINFNIKEMLRFVPLGLEDRVLASLDNKEISGLIVTKDEQIRIKDQPAILQATMDYCGCWYSGFIIPDEEGIITYTGKEPPSDVETLALSLAMDQLATVKGNETLN